MARPKKCRHITEYPKACYFKPQGIPMYELTEAYLSLEGIEAIRLADYQGLNHEQSARLMKISRHTFGRILTAARKTMAQTLIEGQALRIEGGNVAIRNKAGCQTDKKGSTPANERVTKNKNKTKKNDTVEKEMKKIAVSSYGPTLDDKVDPRFGRAGGFVVVDVNTKETQYIDNGGSQVMSHGAGIQAAEIVAKAGADVLLSGYVGPKAFQALSAAGIAIGQNCENLTVREAVDRFLDGEIPVADAPNMER
jgi:predicted DNA-binding protein (UPF0251 family)/predicted Fe-Mo cluster-binding NifX family protein